MLSSVMLQKKHAVFAWYGTRKGRISLLPFIVSISKKKGGGCGGGGGGGGGDEGGDTYATAFQTYRNAMSGIASLVESVKERWSIEAYLGIVSGDMDAKKAYIMGVFRQVSVINDRYKTMTNLPLVLEMLANSGLGKPDVSEIQQAVSAHGEVYRALKPYTMDPFCSILSLQKPMEELMKRIAFQRIALKRIDVSGQGGGGGCMSRPGDEELSMSIEEIIQKDLEGDARMKQTLNSITPYLEVTYEELEKELEELEFGSQSGGTKTTT